MDESKWEVFVVYCAELKTLLSIKSGNIPWGSVGANSDLLAMAAWSSFRENHGCIQAQWKECHNQWVWSAMGVEKMVTWVLDALYPCWMGWLAAGTIIFLFFFFFYSSRLLSDSSPQIFPLSSSPLSWFMIFSRSF